MSSKSTLACLLTVSLGRGEGGGGGGGRVCVCVGALIRDPGAAPGLWRCGGWEYVWTGEEALPGIPVTVRAVAVVIVVIVVSELVVVVGNMRGLLGEGILESF